MTLFSESGILSVKTGGIRDEKGKSNDEKLGALCIWRRVQPVGDCGCTSTAGKKCLCSHDVHVGQGFSGRGCSDLWDQKYGLSLPAEIYDGIAVWECSTGIPGGTGPSWYLGKCTGPDHCRGGKNVTGRAGGYGGWNGEKDPCSAGDRTAGDCTDGRTGEAAPDRNCREIWGLCLHWSVQRSQRKQIGISSRGCCGNCESGSSHRNVSGQRIIHEICHRRRSLRIGFPVFSEGIRWCHGDLQLVR